MSDGINEVGKSLRKTKQNSEAALRRYKRVQPRVDRVRDIFDDIIPFEMEFETEHQDGLTKLDLFFNKPPPLSSCRFGRFALPCREFLRGPGDHLIQVAPYLRGSVSAFLNGVQLLPSQFYEYNSVEGLVFVQGTAASDQVFSICYTEDTWVDCEGSYTLSNFAYQGNLSSYPPDPSGHTNEFNNVWYRGNGWPGDYDTPYRTYAFFQAVVNPSIDINNFSLSFTISDLRFERLSNNADLQDVFVRLDIGLNGGGGISISDSREYNNGPDFFIPDNESSFVWQKRSVGTPLGLWQPDERTDPPYFFGSLHPQSMTGTYSFTISNGIMKQYTPITGPYSGPNPYSPFNVSTVQFVFSMAVEPGIPLHSDEFDIFMQISDLHFGCAKKADGTSG